VKSGRINGGRKGSALRTINSKINKKGNYNLFTNSCATNVVDVSYGAGFRVPLWARISGTLDIWHTSILKYQTKVIQAKSTTRDE
jgi:hypothetical protein